MEGLEEAVLNGAKEFLAINSAPIVLEYRNDAMQRYADIDMSGVVNLLNGFEYKLYALGSGGDLFEFDALGSYENVVAIKESSELNKLLFSAN